MLTPASILAAPFVDYAIIHFGWTGTLHCINGLGLFYLTIKVASDNLNVQIVGFVVFSFYRSFLFGVSFSFLPTLVDGPVIGLGAGIMTGMAGVLSIINIPLGYLAINTFDGDFFWPNMIYLLMIVPCIIAITILARNTEKDDGNDDESNDEDPKEDSNEEEAEA